MDIPDGFKPYEASPFAETFGPLFRSSVESTFVLGLRTERRHANTMDNVHGGLLLALADTSLGHFVRSLIGDGAVAVTVDFHASFMRGARIGQWIEVRPFCDRRGTTMIFTTAEVKADGRTIGKAQATFFVHYQPRAQHKEIS